MVSRSDGGVEVWPRDDPLHTGDPSIALDPEPTDIDCSLYEEADL